MLSHSVSPYRKYRIRKHTVYTVCTTRSTIRATCIYVRYSAEYYLEHITAYGTRRVERQKQSFLAKKKVRGAGDRTKVSGFTRAHQAPAISQNEQTNNNPQRRHFKNRRLSHVSEELLGSLTNLFHSN